MNLDSLSTFIEQKDLMGLGDGWKENQQKLVKVIHRRSMTATRIKAYKEGAILTVLTQTQDHQAIKGSRSSHHKDKYHQLSPETLVL